MDDCRKAFEIWVSDGLSDEDRNACLLRDWRDSHPNNYCLDWVDDSWDAWKASWDYRNKFSYNSYNVYSGDNNWAECVHDFYTNEDGARYCKKCLSLDSSTLPVSVSAEYGRAPWDTLEVREELSNKHPGNSGPICMHDNYQGPTANCPEHRTQNTVDRPLTEAQKRIPSLVEADKLRRAKT